MEINLNIIPSGRKEEIERASHARFTFIWGGEILAILVLCVAVLFSMQYILKLQLAAAEQEAQRGSDTHYKKVREYDELVGTINAETSEIEKIQKSQLYWTKLFQILHEKVPPEIELHGLSTKNYQVSLSGRSATRMELVAFKENLEKNSCMEEVNLPFSNLVSKENLNFQINFKIKKECVQ